MLQEVCVRSVRAMSHAAPTQGAVRWATCTGTLMCPQCMLGAPQRPRLLLALLSHGLCLVPVGGVLGCRGCLPCLGRLRKGVTRGHWTVGHTPA
jgi:hypothetical protein